MVNFIIVFCMLLPVRGMATTWSEQVDSVILRELKSVDTSGENFGIWIKKGSSVSQHNGERLFVPASLSKIPTALTFLNETSMDHRFKTWIYHTGKVKDGVLEGDLYLKGGGDPTLVTEALWIMANELKRSDIKEIRGQVYVDESYFDSDYYSEGRQKKRVDRAYDAPVSALSFNWNSISIYVRPGARPGSPARVYTDPDLPIIKINNSAKTTSRKKSSLEVERKYDDQNIVINVKGAVSVSKDEKAVYKSIKDPSLWTGRSFVQLLNRAGIDYQGTVKMGVTPSDAIEIVEKKSWSMARVMAALSKFSNNFVAEVLTKQLGKKNGQPGNINDGLEKIVNFLKEKGWKPSDFEFVNPSGFTRENKMRPDLLGQLLVDARKRFDYSPEFLASLPISGTDGTLKSRMKQTMRGKVRAKTGYLTGVVALAGYMEARDGGEPLTFVFLYNGPYKQDWKVRAMFNRLLWRVYQKS